MVNKAARRSCSFLGTHCALAVSQGLQDWHAHPSDGIRGGRSSPNCYDIQICSQVGQGQNEERYLQRARGAYGANLASATGIRHDDLPQHTSQ